MNGLVSSIFDIEKGVPQGSCLGPIFFLLFHCELLRRIPLATYHHLYADDLALIIHASLWWSRAEFASQMQRLGEEVLKQVQSYAAEWKQPINFPKTEWQWIHRRVCPPSLDLVVDGNRIKRTSLFKYLGNYVDERFSFDQHCNKMLQKLNNNAGLLKYVTRSRTSSMKARNLIFQAFIQPYFRMIYAVWPLLSNCSIEKIEAKNRQVHRLIQNWSDATNDEVRWFPNFLTAETKAQRFLRFFIDKAIETSPELFDDYILSKAMLMYLQLHVVGPSFIDALSRGRFNKYVYNQRIHIIHCATRKLLNHILIQNRRDAEPFSKVRNASYSALNLFHETHTLTPSPFRFTHSNPRKKNSRLRVFVGIIWINISFSLFSSLIHHNSVMSTRGATRDELNVFKPITQKVCHCTV